MNAQIRCFVLLTASLFLFLVTAHTAPIYADAVAYQNNAAHNGLVASAVTVRAGTIALFDSPTDTIQVGGHIVLGTAATYEASVLFTSQYNATGFIFNEWADSQDDKQLAVTSTIVAGYSYPLNVTELQGKAPSGTLVDGVWHNIAYVYDGSQERIYIDGKEVAARSESGNIGNSSANLPHAGASFRGFLSPSFEGYIDSLRISDVARYTGTSFTPPAGKLSSDNSTLLFYDFDEAPGSTTITDRSGHGLNGTLGVGFAGATSPDFVANPTPEPSTITLFVLGAIGVWFASRRHRVKS